MTGLDDWAVTQEFCNLLQAILGPCQGDLFASDKNNCLPRFNSRFACPNSEAVNSLAQDRSQAQNWIFPPTSLLITTLLWLQHCRAKGIMVVPWWPSNSYWPFIFTWNGPAKFVKWWEIFPDGWQFLIDATQPNSIFTCAKFKSPLLVLALDADS